MTDKYEPKVGHEVNNHTYVGKVVKLIGNDFCEMRVPVNFTGFKHMDIVVRNVDLVYVPRHRAG
jgi:hypothetical protein